MTKLRMTCEKVVTTDDGMNEDTKARLTGEHEGMQFVLTVTCDEHTKAFAVPKQEFLMTFNELNRPLTEYEVKKKPRKEKRRK